MQFNLCPANPVTMKKMFLVFSVLATLVFFGCEKESSADVSYGTEINTWTFTEGSTVYKGHLSFDPILNTYLQTNGSYTFAFIGEERTSANVFNIVLSLVDLNFTAKSYQSGILGTTFLNSFYYSAYNGSPDYIYRSSNIALEVGAVMNYTISAYDPVRDVVTINFSGKAFDKNGNLVNITNGRVTGKIERI